MPGIVMNAIPTDLDIAPAGIDARHRDLAARWHALRDAADAVALLAGIAPEPPGDAEANFPARALAGGGWQLELAERGVDDLAAIMQPGLAALLAARSSGQDGTAAAAVLWHEFRVACTALVDLVPDTRETRPREQA
ncbi:hypothetical protein J4558_00310 [Leptolyngbya sp. 15MV]|nr:hypothetical protein J4558_00310 [Leptolyngbya sp. 15MV]